ncbi:hypothetical protein (chloroplast) [Porphyra umbilicalis]|uniref:DUF4346 domain-containing protein n=1 Tax=Porphyra umbilicalis TaxID=2786 RepID=J7F5N7_PORUM|nr:hypothetical protein [Porphyra umbilicalis]AFC39886.1 hypothetical protein [Porphyra umbilicalis]ASN78690.1 hypothetical protein [Porphyra umbilicalis]|eukprot:ASN78690.1 hypothetical protein (chloroplast) [Porphyra umbilicalis]
MYRNMFLNSSLRLNNKQKQYLKDILILNQISHKLSLDSRSYFLITINIFDQFIDVEEICYNSTGQLYSIFFKDKTAKALCHTIFNSQHVNILLSNQHVAYLARELVKSELGILLSQQYIQD